MNKFTYRGYEVEPHKDGGFTVKKDGQVACQQPDMNAALKWVDQEKRRAAGEVP